MRRILWFRRDLRVRDNALLSVEGEVLPIFIFDTEILKHLDKRDQRVSYIFDRVMDLKTALQARGLDLKIFYGNPVELFQGLAPLGFDEVIASGDYDAYTRERDEKVSMILPFHAVHDTYIFAPEEMCKEDGTPYLLFTPFYKETKKRFAPRHLAEILPVKQQLIPTDYEGIHQTDNLSKLPLEIISIGFDYHPPNVPSVQTKLQRLKKKLATYRTDRDYPALDGTSQLSLELRFGVLGIRELLRFLVDEKKKGIDTEPFYRELIFRDFYAHLLYHFPDLAWKNFKYRFDGVPNADYARAFFNGQTGVPIVDAGIRQLLQTGEMHNRVRMISASFFCKDLLLPWQEGERFFATHLLDYDAASNILSWQWSSGTGVDPQPYFRIFNPWLQAKKFDKDAEYIQHWVPELRTLTPKQIHDENYLLQYKTAGYPAPIVQHKEAMARAKAYYYRTNQTPKFLKEREKVSLH